MKVTTVWSVVVTCTYKSADWSFDVVNRAYVIGFLVKNSVGLA